MLRGLVACGWFGIQTWIGGQAIHTMLKTAFPAWESVPGGAWIALRRLLGLEHVDRGARQRVDQVPGSLGGAVPDRRGPGAARLGDGARRRPRARSWPGPPKFQTTGEFLRFFVPSLTAMVGFWATLALNIPDLSRYARDQQAQVWASSGLPPTMPSSPSSASR